MSEQQRRALIAGGSVITIIVLLYVAWGISAVSGGDLVARNVSVEAVAIGGLDEDDVRAVASDFDDQLRGQPATLQVGEVTIATNLAELGVHTDADQLVDDAFAARKSGPVIFRPFSWLGSFFGDEQIQRVLVVDEDEAEAAAAELIEGQLTEPTDPTFELGAGGITVMAGVSGDTIEFAAVADQVEAALDRGEPFVVELDPVPLPPSLDTDELRALADEANELTDEPLEVLVLDQATVVEPATLRSWIVLDTSGDDPSWEFDNELVVEGLRPLFGGLGSEDQQARFDVVDGAPVIIPASESVQCCADTSAELIAAGLREPLPAADPEAAPDPETETDTEADPEEPNYRSVVLEPITTGSDEGVAELEALGIVEEVSTFTTNHACCQGRVQNIQRMAEIVRGYIIRPGELFDLNEVVGRRTRENGFVAAGAIAQGVIEPQVGGGVSQFTTTIFNAAFFAGLDFVEYQAHSIYFSRYPRGREATISWPKPDFIVRNITPYGILVWPTWTDTSITVTFYSTEHVDVEDLGRSETSQGACTRVTTTRERTYPDGSSERDTVFAVYRPGEGLDCAGNSTRPTTAVPSDETSSTVEGESTTTAPGESTTTAPGETTTAPATTAPPPTAPPPSDPPPSDPPPDGGDPPPEE